ncbi:uncharacterized protein DMAD_07730 [Drosophila madeirensis]
MADTISGTLQEEFRRGFMELMAAITEALTPLRHRGEIIQDLVWEDDPNGREGGQTALECQKQSTKHRCSGEHQEQIPQEPPRKPERRSQNWSFMGDDGELDPRPEIQERKPAGDGGARSTETPYALREARRVEDIQPKSQLLEGEKKEKRKVKTEWV